MPKVNSTTTMNALVSMSMSSSIFRHSLPYFLPWLENKAALPISSNLYIGKSSFGRSLFASKNIQAGDCLLQVPFSVQLTPDNLLPQLKPLIPNQLGNLAKLALVILVEQNKAQVSEWAPYITCLPKLEDMHSTLFWSAQELEMIQHSSVYQDTVYQQTQMENDYLALRPALDRFPQFFKDVSLENFRYAYGLGLSLQDFTVSECMRNKLLLWRCTSVKLLIPNAKIRNAILAVASRAWGSTKGLSLIPFADFLNHDGASKSIVLSDEDKQISEVIADRNYLPGEEVMIRYGMFPNSTLLLDFGFTVPCNSYDQVSIQLNITSDDHLRALKLDLLRKHSLPKVKGVNFNSSDGPFVIKKVRLSTGKGKGIPQSLRAFARVLCCNSSKELDELALEATQHDGRLARRPLTNRSLERLAHEILVSKVYDMIDTHNTSINSLESLEVTNCRTRDVRQLMARNLLTSEVQVLKSAAAWLENYCHGVIL